MVRPYSRKIKSIPMKIGNDSALWCFDSLQEAIDANTDLMAQFICTGKEESMALECNVEASVESPTSEELKSVKLK